jgi:hypothetical protein
MGSNDQKCCFSSRAYFVLLSLIFPSLLSLIESSLQCLLIMPTFIVVLAINDKHSLSVKYFPIISPFGIDGNTITHMHSNSPPRLFSPPLTSMSKKKHAPPELLQNILPLSTMSILEIHQIFNKYSP